MRSHNPPLFPLLLLVFLPLLTRPTASSSWTTGCAPSRRCFPRPYTSSSIPDQPTSHLIIPFASAISRNHHPFLLPQPSSPTASTSLQLFLLTNNMLWISASRRSPPQLQRILSNPRQLLSRGQPAAASLSATNKRRLHPHNCSFPDQPTAAPSPRPAAATLPATSRQQLHPRSNSIFSSCSSPPPRDQPVQPTPTAPPAASSSQPAAAVPSSRPAVAVATPFSLAVNSHLDQRSPSLTSSSS